MNGLLRPWISTRVGAPLLLVLAALPAVYLLIAIQYSAITVPFWDHVELIRSIAAWKEGHFQISSFWAPHNHARPLVYRLVMVLNAAATDWDIRSEFIYVYLSIYGTFACYVWLACRIVTGPGAAAVRPLTLLTLSLLLFSPAGHNNHWWSLMFILDANNLFVALSMALVFVRPTSWPVHVVAVISCWLAAWSLTNGFFAFAAIIATLQLSSPRLLRPDRFALFWTANFVVASLLYLPGVHLDESPKNPSILQLIEFTLAYLGVPLRSLLWFPYNNMFHVPLSLAGSVICGIVLVASCAALSWLALPRLRRREPAAMVLFGFCGFAMISAVATGWARAAFDQFGPATGNSSRYTIFGVYLLIGQVYFVGAGLAQGWWDEKVYPLLSRRVVFSASAIFILVAFANYGRAWRVYADAHVFNRMLAQAYGWGTAPVPGDKFIHPSAERVAYLKGELQKWNLGPYAATRPLEQRPSAVGPFSKAALLSATRTVSQRFTASEDDLARISLKFVTPAGASTRGLVTWRLVEAGKSEPAATGEIEAASARDWADVELRLPVLQDSKNRSYELILSGTTADATALGVPLYAPVEGSLPPAVQSADAGHGGTEVMDLTLKYAK